MSHGLIVKEADDYFRNSPWVNAGITWTHWVDVVVLLVSRQQTGRAPAQDGEQNGLMGRVDEGVDEFFSKKVAKMDSK